MIDPFKPETDPPPIGPGAPPPDGSGPPQPVDRSIVGHLKTAFAPVKALWMKVRSNPVIVAAEGGATGAVLNFLIGGGKLDFSSAGLHQLATVAFIGAVTAVKLLYRMPPNPTIPATIPPSSQVEQVAAKLEPVNPAAVPVSPEGQVPGQPSTAPPTAPPKH